MKHSTENAQALFVKPIFPKLARVRRCRLQFVSVDLEGEGESNEFYTITIPVFSVQCSGSKPAFTAPSFFQLRCEVFTFTSLTNGQIWKETAETPPCHPHSRGLLVKEC